ncbi:MAG: phosphatase PAP2 family protein [Planctomycetaceae bacterium]
MIPSLRRHWNASDTLVAGYLLLLLGLTATHLPAIRAQLDSEEGGRSTGIPSWIFLATHGLLLGLLLLLVARGSRARRPLWRVLRDWYPVLYIPAFYKQLLILVPAVSPHDMDEVLLRMDAAFGGDRLVRGLSRITTDFLTDLLKLCWSSYILLPFLAAVPIYRRLAPEQFRAVRFAFVLAWLSTYVGYFLTPAIGMGYYLDRIGATGTGGSATLAVHLKGFFDLLEGKMRDSYPSGHAAIGVVAIWVHLRYRLALRFVVVPVTLGLIFATVYLRYHYIVDLLAGVVAGAAGVVVAEAFLRREGGEPIGPAIAR